MISRRNNFDLIRLFAALLVVFFHLHNQGFVDWIGMSAKAYNKLTRLLPPVPIFFMLSGFLITHNWLHKPEIGRYIKARLLRIYPAFFMATLLATIVFMIMGLLPIADLAQWFASQFSIFAIRLAPSELTAHSGNGVPNDALWTIPVEMEFYILLPILFFLSRKSQTSLKVMAIGGILLALALARQLYIEKQYPVPIPEMPYLPNHFLPFGLGMLAALHWQQLKKYTENKFFYWLVFYIFLCLVIPHSHILPAWLQSPFLMVFLMPVLLSAAFTKHNLSNRLLKGTDVSYGIYVYHYPILYLVGWVGFANFHAMVVSLALILPIGYLSWHLIEKPFLDLKSRQFTKRK